MKNVLYSRRVAPELKDGHPRMSLVITQEANFIIAWLSDPVAGRVLLKDFNWRDEAIDWCFSESAKSIITNGINQLKLRR